MPMPTDVEVALLEVEEEEGGGELTEVESIFGL